MTLEQFKEQYKNYKNHFGKISGFTYICKACAKEFDSILINNGSLNILNKMVLNKINNLQNEAKLVKISSKEYNYISDEQLFEISQTIQNAKSIQDAINYLYQACLYGDGLDSKGQGRGRRKRDHWGNIKIGAFGHH